MCKKIFLPGFLTNGTSIGTTFASDTLISGASWESSSIDNSDGEVQQSQRSYQTKDSTPIRLRTLREIYETCSFELTISDPMSYEEAQENPEWRSSVQDELFAI